VEAKEMTPPEMKEPSTEDCIEYLQGYKTKALRNAVYFEATMERLRKLAAMVEERDKQIERLKRNLKETEREAREDARSSAAETTWRERQGEDYGSY
jgi:hypothetical protein